MLSPELMTLEISSEMRRAIQDKVFEALFRSIRELPPRPARRKGPPSLTVTEAKERLAIALPEYREVVGQAIPVNWTDLGFTAIQMGTVLHEWIDDASTFFRREGGGLHPTGAAGRRGGRVLPRCLELPVQPHDFGEDTVIGIVA